MTKPDYKSLQNLARQVFVIDGELSQVERRIQLLRAELTQAYHKIDDAIDEQTKEAKSDGQ